METTIRPPTPLRSGPFVTASGRRLPVRVLTERNVPALLEFYDYRSRRAQTIELLGVPNAGREMIGALTDRDLEAAPMLAIMAGPSALIRGVAQYSSKSIGSAQTAFTIDESLDGDHVSDEMLRRLAEHAREAGIVHLEASAQPGSPLLDAIQRCGFPFQRVDGSDHYSLAIT